MQIPLESEILPKGWRINYQAALSGEEKTGEWKKIPEITDRWTSSHHLSSRENDWDFN